jgi:hypothetical protein
VRRLVRQPLTLTLPADVARSWRLRGRQPDRPTLATAMLHAADIVPDGALALNWGTWWIGDLSGMLIATPIALTLIGRPRSEWAPRPHPGRRDARPGDRLPRPGDRPDGALEHGAGARGVQP